MSIGKLIAFAALLAASACSREAPPAAMAGNAPAAAWWVTRDFPASGATVRGVPVAAIAPEWRAATELTDNHLRGVVSAAEHAAIARGGFAQSLTDGANTLVVGTYRAETGGGRFLLALADGRVVARLTDPGPQAFSTLMRTAGGIRWYKCMECSDYDTVVRSGSTYVIE